MTDEQVASCATLVTVQKTLAVLCGRVLLAACTGSAPRAVFTSRPATSNTGGNTIAAADIPPPGVDGTVVASTASAGQRLSGPCDPVKMLTFAGDWNGYAGGSAGIVIFANVGRTACTFAGGYPEVRFVGASGQVLSVAAPVPVPSAKASFDLPPGGSVGTKILMDDLSFQPKVGCGPQSATEILISSPGGRIGTSISGTFEVCTQTSSVGVEPVQDLPGLTGY